MSEVTSRSIHSGDVEQIYDVPMSAIIRPIPSVLEEGKVCSFVDLLSHDTEMTPIDLMWVKTKQGNYYFAFGGCHRWEAHVRLGRKTIRAKLVPTSPKTIKLYMGSSTPSDILKAAAEEEGLQSTK